MKQVGSLRVTGRGWSGQESQQKLLLWPLPSKGDKESRQVGTQLALSFLPGMKMEPQPLQATSLKSPSHSLAPLHLLLPPYLPKEQTRAQSPTFCSRAACQALWQVHGPTSLLGSCWRC